MSFFKRELEDNQLPELKDEEVNKITGLPWPKNMKDLFPGFDAAMKINAAAVSLELTETESIVTLSDRNLAKCFDPKHEGRDAALRKVDARELELFKNLEGLTSLLCVSGLQNRETLEKHGATGSGYACGAWLMLEECINKNCKDKIASARLVTGGKDPAVKFAKPIKTLFGDKAGHEVWITIETVLRSFGKKADAGADLQALFDVCKIANTEQEKAACGETIKTLMSDDPLCRDFDRSRFDVLSKTKTVDRKKVTTYYGRRAIAEGIAPASLSKKKSDNTLSLDERERLDKILKSVDVFTFTVKGAAPSQGFATLDIAHKECDRRQKYCREAGKSLRELDDAYKKRTERLRSIVDAGGKTTSAAEQKKRWEDAIKGFDTSDDEATKCLKAAEEAFAKKSREDRLQELYKQK